MIDKQLLVVECLKGYLNQSKTGIIIKGIEGISPYEIAKEIYASHSPLYVAIIGYNGFSEGKDELYITHSIENAVLWRSNPECAGHILVFIRNDTEKMHSLAEFEVISTRNISQFLLEKQIKPENNTPTNNFWEALKDTSDYYTFDVLYEFVSSVVIAEKPEEAITNNMWRINLLSDPDILGSKSRPKERLEKNRNLIFAIGQLSEESRKKLSRTLARTRSDNNNKLQKAYLSLQNLYKYGKRETLKDLDYITVLELFSASQKKKKTKKNDNPEEANTENGPIRPAELDTLISNAVVFGDDEELENLQELFNGLRDYYNSEEEVRNDGITPVGGIFGDRAIALNNQTDLRRLVGRFCNQSAWGGLMETEESVLKDAISADISKESFFDPESADSIVAFSGGIDGKQSLFDFIQRFDAQFDAKGIESAIRFSPIISDLKNQRKRLLASTDFIMYHPTLLFGASEEDRQVLIDYIQAWENLYRAICVNEPIMREISAGGTSFIARAILLLDILYVKTPKEWKGILLPLHPIYLWRFYEVFRSFASKKSTMSDDDKKTLSVVLSRLPQVLSFIIANGVVTGLYEDRVLPCSGSIEMLPSFENKTNRYLGDDGTESIEEILARWIGFAPYTKNEIRICSVDAPNLIAILRQIKTFMDNNSCKRVVYDVYLTRNQNGNTELSKLEYSGKDYEIGEYIRKGRIAISIRNVDSAYEVKQALNSRPVHVAFYFDQSSYAIEFGPNSQNLYITAQ